MLQVKDRSRDLQSSATTTVPWLSQVPLNRWLHTSVGGVHVYGTYTLYQENSTSMHVDPSCFCLSQYYICITYIQVEYLENESNIKTQ